MKQLLGGIVLVLALMSCNSGGNNANGGTTDSAGHTNPSAIDTIQHPNGMTNDAAISTDTAAMSVPPKSDEHSKGPDRDRTKNK